MAVADGDYTIPHRLADGQAALRDAARIADGIDQYCVPVRLASGQFALVTVDPVESADEYCFPVRLASGQRALVTLRPPGTTTEGATTTAGATSTGGTTTTSGLTTTRWHTEGDCCDPDRFWDPSQVCWPPGGDAPEVCDVFRIEAYCSESCPEGPDECYYVYEICRDIGTGFGRCGYIATQWACTA